MRPDVSRALIGFGLRITRSFRRFLCIGHYPVGPTRACLDQCDLTPGYLIRDRDKIYGAAVTRRLRTMGIRDKPIAPGSPWQNGFVERLIGTIRRECVDHIVALGEQHLRRFVKSLCELLQHGENSSLLG
jgi:integrase-like protein